MQELQDVIRGSDKYDGKKDAYFFNWDGQKEYLLRFAWEYYLDDPEEITPSEAIEVAHNFLETFRNEVIDINTKIYYKR